MTPPIPQGTVTIVFTDLEGSSALWERLKGGFLKLLEEHNALIRQTAAPWSAYEVKTEGDRFMLAFQHATDAVQCAIDVQLAFAQHDGGEEVGALKVRIGIHTGEPFLGYDPQGKPDYFGPAVNRAARICDAGHGGQILLSAVTASLVRDALKAEQLLLDLGEHRLRGLERPERLFQIVHPDIPQKEFPPLRTLDAYRHNLPLPLSSFVGREKELATLRESLLLKQQRLITLTGIGGSGKTRLALELAHQVLGRFPNGVYWVSLADIEKADLFPQALARALKVALEPKGDLWERILARLSDGECLVILDNFEHIPEAVWYVRRLLEAAPHWHCLVTSRVLLQMEGEAAFEVTPLELPQDGAEAAGAVLGYSAVQLFVERAQAAKREWSLTEENASVVAEICHRAEGIPLAIEMAASHVRTMTEGEILERFGRQLEIEWQRRDVPERHKTMRAALG